MSNRNYILLIFIVAILCGIASCSGDLTKVPLKKELVIFPSPPDTARVQFLTSISDSKDIVGKQSSFSRFLFGEEKPKQINKPYGIEIKNGKMYVCDITIKGLEIIDLKKQTFEYFIPKGKGALILPVNCFVDEKGYLYVADIQRQEIVIFDNNGNYVNSFGGVDNFKPSDVFVDNEKIWVSNSANNKVFIYSKDTHKLLDDFPKLEKGDPGFLYSPTNIFVTKEKVYVSDFGDFKIKVYTPEGKLIQSIGSYGKSLGQFVRPKGIAVDHESNLYAVDAGFENVQVFDKNGQLLMFFGGSYSGAGYMWLPATVIIDYDNLEFFRKYVDDSYNLKYLIIVTNQYGPDKINIYGSVEPKH